MSTKNSKLAICLIAFLCIIFSSCGRKDDYKIVMTEQQACLILDKRIADIIINYDDEIKYKQSIYYHLVLANANADSVVIYLMPSLLKNKKGNILYVQQIKNKFVYISGLENIFTIENKKAQVDQLFDPVIWKIILSKKQFVVVKNVKNPMVPTPKASEFKFEKK